MKKFIAIIFAAAFLASCKPKCVECSTSMMPPVIYCEGELMYEVYEDGGVRYDDMFEPYVCVDVE